MCLQPRLSRSWDRSSKGPNTSCGSCQLPTRQSLGSLKGIGQRRGSLLDCPGNLVQKACQHEWIRKCRVSYGCGVARVSLCWFVSSSNSPLISVSEDYRSAHFLKSVSPFFSPRLSKAKEAGCNWPSAPQVSEWSAGPCYRSRLFGTKEATYPNLQSTWIRTGTSSAESRLFSNFPGSIYLNCKHRGHP